MLSSPTSVESRIAQASSRIKFNEKKRPDELPTA